MKNFMDDGWQINGLAREDRFGEWLRITRENAGITESSALRIIRFPANDEEYETAKSTLLAEEETWDYFYEMVERTTAECQVMSALRDNPNIIGYEEYSVVENEEGFGWTVYIRTELLRPLLSYAKEHPLSVTDVIRLGIDIANALDACRKFEIIHRDLRPDTIFVTNDGHFKLGGFDISHEREKVASDREKKNSNPYMSPEQMGGKNYDYRSDQYSLGLILYRFLNHERMPFLPPAPEPIRYRDREEAKRKIAEGKTIPAPAEGGEALAEIIQKACAFKPDRRYESAGELRDALKKYLTKR